MRFTALVCLLIAVFLSSTYAQVISGRIVDKRSNPIAGATVTLVAKNKSATSKADGTFMIQAVAIISPYNTSSAPRSVLMSGNSLLFTNETPQTIRVELFDMSGKRCSNVFSRRFEAGSYSLPISSLISQRSANGLYIVRVTHGTQVSTHPFNPLCSFKSDAGTIRPHYSAVAQKLSTADTLKVSKTGFVTVGLSLDSDVNKDFGDISLDSENDLAIEKKVDSLLALMTDDEKIAQTSEVLVDAVGTDDVKNNMYGSVFNGGGYPFSDNKKETWAQQLDALHDAAKNSRLHIPILYGIDAVHGNGTIEGATVFPHNIAMGCTHDTALVAKMANITAKECRAVGINLNFAPAISVVRNEKWGRTYEGYGETPEINTQMAEAYIRGLQGFGDMSRPDAMAACAKHFIGDGGTIGGVNGGETKLSEATLRAIHLPPYQAAVKVQVSAVMPSYNAWNNNGQTTRCTNSKQALTDMLKTELKFDGFCLSDWDAIPRALASTNDQLFYADNNVDAAINAGIDMAMIAHAFGVGVDVKRYITQYNNAFKNLVTANTISKARLDDAVKRILRIKFRLNLFENAKSSSTLLAEFGGDAHRTVARECVQKSLVLLKNENSALPLKKSENIVVVGPWANKIGAQCGGWTISWQGAVENPTIVGTTILDGLKAAGSNVTFDETGNDLSSADKIVLVVGEGTYAETEGDHGFKNSADYVSCASCNDYKDQTMSILLASCPHADLIDKCKASGKPVVIVLLSGRPMIITQEIAKCDAFVAAWLPGSEGEGVADVLYGDKPFSGKLTHTWPKSLDQIPINTGTAYNDEPKGSGGDPLFPYGYGLTYEP